MLNFYDKTGFEDTFYLGGYDGKVVLGVAANDAPPFEKDDTQTLGAMLMTRDQVGYLLYVIQQFEEKTDLTRQGLAMNHHLVKPLEMLHKVLSGVKFEPR